MIKIIRDNRWFFIGFALCWIIGFILLISSTQGDEILFFSNVRTYFGDLFFRQATRMGEEEAYFILIALMLFYRIRIALLVPLTGAITMLIALIVKVIFGHDRPSVFFTKLERMAEINLVEGVDLLTGNTSFPSGHTMSAFALFGMLAFLFKRKKWLGLLMLLLALLVGISRIYLVQHFLKDVLFGSVLGVLIAMGIYVIQSRTPFDPTQWYDQALIKRRKRIA